MDAHKAAYLPVCIASTSSNDELTAEPAVVVPTIAETEQELLEAAPGSPMIGHVRSPSVQYGATLRRAPTLVSPTSTRGFGSTRGFETPCAEPSNSETNKQK